MILLFINYMLSFVLVIRYISVCKEVFVFEYLNLVGEVVV